MATKILKTVEGNTGPALSLTAQRPGGTVIPLAGCTVALIITKGGTVTNTGHQACTIINAPSGVVSYTRQATDTPTAGKYVCDLRVTYADATIEVLYDQLILNCRKRADSTT